VRSLARKTRDREATHLGVKQKKTKKNKPTPKPQKKKKTTPNQQTPKPNQHHTNTKKTKNHRFLLQKKFYGLGISKSKRGGAGGN